jgi:cell division protein FtsZ
MAYIEPKSTNIAKIKVVGVGGGGQNAVDSMIELNRTEGVEFIAMNTDLQVLNISKAPVRLQLGPQRTHGLGSGADPQVGHEAASESTKEIESQLAGSDMVFIAAGFGGGTGTGAAPMVAKIAKDLGALTIGVVTKPFVFEGKRRMTQAEQGVKELKDKLDALIVIPNEKLLEVVDYEMPLKDAFKVADQVIGQAVEGISELITSTGLVNVDFADVKSVMQNAGSALMGIGYANGEDRAERAAKGAINSPLLDVDIKGCTGLLINIVGDETLTMHEVNTAANLVSESAHEGANIIFGANISNEVDGVKVTVIATGFDSDFKSVQLPSEASTIRSEDIVSQIDSRFDQIQQAQQSQQSILDDNSDDNMSSSASANDDDDDDYKKNTSNNSNRKNSAARLDPLDDFVGKPSTEEYGNFDFEQMREEVRKMDANEGRPRSSSSFFDDDYDTEENKEPVKPEPKKEEPKKEEPVSQPSTPGKRIRPSSDIKSSGLWRFIKERSK